MPVSGELRMVGPWPVLHQLASGGAYARIQAARGDYAGAASRWRSLIAIEDALPYHEPPAWYPVRESLGATLLLSGDAAAAEAAFRDDLVHTPKNPRSLLGLALCLEREGHAAEAARYRREFAKAWKGVSQPAVADY